MSKNLAFRTVKMYMFTLGEVDRWSLAGLLLVPVPVAVEVEAACSSRLLRTASAICGDTITNKDTINVLYKLLQSNPSRSSADERGKQGTTVLLTACSAAAASASSDGPFWCVCVCVVWGVGVGERGGGK